MRKPRLKRTTAMMVWGLIILVLSLTLALILTPRRSHYMTLKENQIMVEFRKFIPEQLPTSYGYARTGIFSIDALNEKYHIDSVKRLGSGYDNVSIYYLFKSAIDFDVLTAATEYRFDPNVRSAQPLYHWYD